MAEETELLFTSNDGEKYDGDSRQQASAIKRGRTQFSADSHGTTFGEHYDSCIAHRDLRLHVSTALKFEKKLSWKRSCCLQALHRRHDGRGAVVPASNPTQPNPTQSSSASLGTDMLRGALGLHTTDMCLSVCGRWRRTWRKRKKRFHQDPNQLFVTGAACWDERASPVTATGAGQPAVLSRRSCFATSFMQN